MTGLLVALSVVVGASLGAATRYGFGRKWDRPDFHTGTLSANVIGSGILGFALAADVAWPGLAAGFCGGLTTYSAFAVQAAEPHQSMKWPYVVMSLGLCVLIFGLCSLIGASVSG